MMLRAVLRRSKGASSALALPHGGRKIVNAFVGGSHGSYTAGETHGAPVLTAMTVAAFGVAAWTGQDMMETQNEAKKNENQEGEVELDLSAIPGKTRGRRHLLKNRSKLREKMEEVDMMKVYLQEYTQRRETSKSLETRFQAYASKAVGENRMMTFTDFVHSLILPRFRTRNPLPDVTYTCEFVGDANGLITYEECYLLLHLLQIPNEHFNVAFCMFDLDGDGSVDKVEFCHVIENLLGAIATKEHEEGVVKHISAEDTLPRLTKYLFGRFGKKTIRAQELEAALNLLRKQILKAEFDLYAREYPKNKNQRVISVHDFAISLISGFDPARLPPYLERVQKLHASEEIVTWDDFYNFHFHVQNNLEDIKLAFDLIGAEEITEADFIRAAHVVTGVELPFSVVQLAFRIFDSNDNGTLDQSELLKVLEMRNIVELKKMEPESTLKKFWNCLRDQHD